MDILLLLLGVAVLLAGGELLVRGAVGLALKFKISAAVVGLTVVALGTSAPELVVSAGAALKGNPAIALGNVIGSNIVNITLILGVTTIIFPIAVSKTTRRIDLPMMLFASGLLYVVCADNSVTWIEGLGMVLILVTFIIYSIYKSRKSHEINTAELEAEDLKKNKERPLYLLILFVVVGCIGLVYGANWFLQGAESIARSLGVSDRIIAITLVAFGTSVPELAASIVAALRKQNDISLGNVIGSNLFNILGILGITALIKKLPVLPEVLSSDLWWMIGTAIILVPIIYIGKKIGRLGGSVLLAAYGVFVYFLLV